jgi:hypothetical protein
VPEFTFLANQVNNRPMVYPVQIFLFVGVVYSLLCSTLQHEVQMSVSIWRVRAELNSHQYSQDSFGRADFQRSVARIHHLLFEQTEAVQ